MSGPRLKTAYVRSIRALRGAAKTAGVLGILERSERRSLKWVRSLFSIYDSQDLISLDLPWWTFPAIDAIDAELQRKPGGARVFEYGAGASTVWLARRAREVISVEHDQAFAQSLREPLSAFTNVRLTVVPPAPARDVTGEARSNRHGYRSSAFDDYVNAIRRAEGVFDLIVIDGRSRAACAAASREKLAPGGIILFDNSNRAEYQSAIADSGLRVRRLRGLTPALPFPSETALLFSEAAR